MRRRINVCVAPGFYVYLAMLVLLLPLKWLIAAVFVASVHELGHIAAMKLRRIGCQEVVLDIGGAQLLTGDMGPADQFICASAGPAAGAAMMLLFPVWPEAAICAGLHTAFNLLPLLPFDGGRILRSALVRLLGYAQGGRVYAFTAAATVGILVYAAFRAIRCIPVLLPAALVLAVRQYKNMVDKY